MTRADRHYAGVRLIRSWRLYAPGEEAASREFRGTVKKNIIPFCEVCVVPLGSGACQECVVYDVIES